MQSLETDRSQWISLPDSNLNFIAFCIPTTHAYAHAHIIEVSREVLDEMTDVGILTKSLTEFSEDQYCIDRDSYAWRSSFTMSKGKREIFKSSKSASKMSKLELIFALGNEGWNHDVLANMPAQYYADGMPKQFLLQTSKARHYFEALLDSANVLRKFPASGDHVPYIHHQGTATYYRALLVGVATSVSDAILCIGDYRDDDNHCIYARTPLNWLKTVSVAELSRCHTAPVLIDLFDRANLQAPINPGLNSSIK